MERSKKIFDKNFKLVRKIGQGQFGEVNSYVHKQTAQMHAGKIMNANSIQNIAFILKEIDTMRQLKHSNLINIQNFYIDLDAEEQEQETNKQSNKRKYERNSQKCRQANIGMLMELADRNMDEQIQIRNKKFNFFTIKDMQKIIKSMIKFFAYMERSGFIHRDIKPANILLLKNNDKIQYKVADLGLSVCLKYYDQQTIAGTYSYASPRLRKKFENQNQVIKGNSVKDDVYSLGMTLLNICTLEYTQPSQQAYYFVQKLYGKEIALVIFSMLCSDEKKRPSFVQLYQYLKIGSQDKDCRNSEQYHWKNDETMDNFVPETRFKNNYYKKWDNLNIRTVKKPCSKVKASLGSSLKSICKLPSKIVGLQILQGFQIKTKNAEILTSTQKQIICGFCNFQIFIHSHQRTLIIALSHKILQIKVMGPYLVFLTSNNKINQIQISLLLIIFQYINPQNTQNLKIQKLFYQSYEIPIPKVCFFEWDQQNSQFIYGTSQNSLYAQNMEKNISVFDNKEEKINRIKCIDKMFFIQGQKTLVWYPNLKNQLAKRSKKFKAHIKDFKVLYKEGQILVLILLANGSIIILDRYFEEKNTFVISLKGILAGKFGKGRQQKNVTFIDFEGKVFDEQGQILEILELLGFQLQFVRKNNTIYFGIDEQIKVFEI